VEPAKLAAYDYELPPERIALHPPARRDASRLLVMERGGGLRGHHHFFELPTFLRSGDLLVLNDTFVIPARLRARRVPTGGRVEIFLLKPERPGTWEVLWRPHRRVRPGMQAVVESAHGDARLTAEVVGTSASGHELVQFRSSTGTDVARLLDELGETPIPPYIKREPEPEDRERYQTVYARVRGSVAAPTAGLHFSPELLEELTRAGVRQAHVTLHVGLATFRPLTDQELAGDALGEEYLQVSAEIANLVNETRARGGRVVAVGTTVVRALESAWRAQGAEAGSGGCLAPFRGTTRCFIKPPYTFRAVDALVTNFHLPRSSLIILAAAFAGREPLLAAYGEAMQSGYRFASYGDAMLIV